MKGFHIFMAPQSVEMQPTDSDTSASQWSLCCVRFPTDSAVCLWARGAGESLEKHTAGRLLNLKEKDSIGKRRGQCRHSGFLENDCTTSIRRQTSAYCTGRMLHFTKRNQVFLFSLKYTISLESHGGIYVDKYTSRGFLYAESGISKFYLFLNSKLPYAITLHSHQDHRMLYIYLHLSIPLSSLVHINVLFSAAYTLFAHFTQTPLHGSLTLF